MMIIYLICITLGFSNAIPDFLSNYISLCKPCTAFWFGIIIGLIAYQCGNILAIEVLVIPSISYFINKLNQEKLL